MEPTLPLKPLVYACSGCSSAAQLANRLAIDLDRNDLATMSCISGVGGGVAPLVRLAQSGLPILALDGCPLHCVSACLQQVGVKPDTHLTLSEHGVKKRRHADWSEEDRARLWPLLTQAAGQLQQKDH